MVNRSSLNIDSVRVLMSGWVVALFLFASVSFADPVQYTDSTIPAANITIGTDGVEFQLSAAKTYAYTMSGTGAFYKTGAGTLTLNKNGSTFTGDVNLNGGKIKVTVAWTGSKSALGAVQSGRNIYVNSGTELIFANQNIFNNAHNNNPLPIVIDGGKVSNEGDYYNFLQYLTLKNGGNLHAASGNETWEAYKLQNLNVVSNSDGSAAAAATITGANNTHAVISFGAKSDEVATKPSTIYVENITNNANSDLIISAKIVNATTVNTGVKTAGEISKTGSGTLELKNINNSFSGNLTIKEGTVKVTVGSNADNRTASALGASNVAGREVIINKGAVLELAAQDVICDAHANSQITFVLDGGKITNSGANYNFLQNVTLRNGANIYAANANTSWEAYKIQNLRVERNSDNSKGTAVTLTAASGDHNVFTFGAISSKITTTPVSIYVEDITSEAGSSDNATDILISAKIVDANIDGKTKKAAPIVKSGAGTLELKNAGNTYSGSLTINAGRVKLTSGSSSNDRTASALGSGNTTGRTVTVNNGAILEFATQDVIINAHSNTKLTIVVDGGQIINSGANYNYLQNLVLRNGGSLYAANGNAKWKAYKLHNLKVERNSDGSAGLPVTISADSNVSNATIAFGAKSGNAATVTSIINVEEITSSDKLVNDNKSDLIISAIIKNPLINSDGTSTPSPIEKTGAGTMELTADNTISGTTTISGGTLKLTGDGTLGTSPVTVNNNGTLEIAYEDSSKAVNFSSVTMAEGSSLKVTSGKVTFGTDDVALNNLSGEDGTIDVSGKLTLNNDQPTQYTGSIKADTIEKTGSETLKIYTGAEGLVEAQSFVISSGRIDLKGFMAGSITIEDAVFSPGNSIGEATFTDDFILGSAASMLLMEIGGENPDQNDSLIAGGDLQFNDGLIYLALTGNNTLNHDDTFTAVLSGSSSGDDGFAEDLLSLVRSYNFTDLEYVQLDESYGEEYKDKFAIRGRYVDPNVVPEPSTWALLALGVAGLMYWRKRTRK
ncbi:MAG: autotransporter-associated beta strand repeat-containing protein [Thermoguttaceae bacterium]|nr:autotransporter-associated beta strand repeat-containing protein [Thermoguttaceae bacterium]